jgi:phage shock protein A
MMETFWEQGVAVENQPETALKEPVAEPGSLVVSADDFTALEERVLHAVELLKQERGARVRADARAAQSEERATQTEERARQAEERATQAEERAGRNEEFIRQAEDRIRGAEERATLAESQLHEQIPVLEQMQTELKSHRTERDQVRQRVERLLKQLDGLEL